MDDSIENIDVVDDYISERAQVLMIQGNSFAFNTGDYVVKTLLGAVV